MAKGKDTIWEKFLSPVFRLFIDEKGLRRYADSIDWEQESARWRRCDVITPSYYAEENFHGVEGGYLNSSAAVSYDPITQYVLVPNETLVRQALIDAIKVQPRRILDLGCGTGSTTLMLKQAFPAAEVIGLDLSPYMLVRAADKARNAFLDIQWRHGNAETTDFPDGGFDLVTAALLFHETPSAVCQSILRESFRLLVPGGQVLIVDGNQNTLRHLNWLNNIFEEPYIRDYAADNLDARMGAAGFEAVRTQDFWWINQVTSGIKPMAVTDANVQSHTHRYVQTLDTATDNNELDDFGSPAFGIIK
ncbi:class I SAM-dependent methyltransferase [Umezakia ovalisporum]|uniref:Class I SAM-dependent methyltransferase n=2 Tax=Umezakia ovalisporum TaxID=75695 RepID=A0AA43H0S0_9CYAN|nr:class I SAM-dependent methyltransferase [Umezakia ovalisporum]MDH6057078.1 class I SAM-dependent methyltransferase [Umezakia ovalisporum FSS-43]MDH6065026.1 class I SAM-dependent methyltransferase [Umezakia ovalisporum FSS-62]MDH6067191.1 class I SAM-dependent methyltransferase [Umezakia ovalisporum APH033B]MDH6071391.1 class I SAM-dependent methyltransferase [Umezakia ovalisporum CobakiLakeA]MDH6075031.1 class I SAM-dependent methyltransferase [Umezakia ovalisporum CS-1034]